MLNFLWPVLWVFLAGCTDRAVIGELDDESDSQIDFSAVHAPPLKAITHWLFKWTELSLENLTFRVYEYDSTQVSNYSVLGYPDLPHLWSLIMYTQRIHVWYFHALITYVITRTLEIVQATWSCLKVRFLRSAPNNVESREPSLLIHEVDTIDSGDVGLKEPCA